jgi:hypothetical protein
VLSDKLGVDIDPELLSVALTHRSFAYENGGIPHNERLEFLGDSILGQAVTVHLFLTHPELEEGALAKRRASVVSTVALAEVARGIDLARTCGSAAVRIRPAGATRIRSSPTRWKPSSAPRSSRRGRTRPRHSCCGSSSR